MISSPEIIVSTENSSEIHYFIVNSESKIILNGIKETADSIGSINLDRNSAISEGVHTIKIFAASDDVLKPYEYSKSFMIISKFLVWLHYFCKIYLIYTEEILRNNYLAS